MLIIAVISTEERVSKLEKELENANDLLAAARQRGNKIHAVPVLTEL